MSHWRKVVRREWDRIVTDICFIIYGIWTLVDPPRSVASQTPQSIVILFAAEFIFAGLALMLGLLIGNWQLRVAGTIVYCIGLGTTAGLVFLYSQSAVGILLIGFALQGLTNLRTSRENRVVARAAEALIADTQ